MNTIVASAVFTGTVMSQYARFVMQNLENMAELRDLFMRFTIPSGAIYDHDR